MTLNSFVVARCTSTFFPLGAPAISSTAHWPATVAQPSIPPVSKSNVSVVALSGSLISAGAARARPRRLVPKAPIAASAALSTWRRGSATSAPTRELGDEALDVGHDAIARGLVAVAHRRHVPLIAALAARRHHVAAEADDAR